MTGKPAGPAVRRDCTCLRARHEHGTEAGYGRDKCRCDDCRAAHAAEYRKRSRGIAYGTWEPTRPAIGSTRRVRALACMGWSNHQIAPLAGLSRTAVRHIRNGASPLVTVRAAEGIAAVFDQLWNAAPPSRTPHERRAIVQVLNRARARNWAPPLAWDDIDDPTAVPVIDLPDSGELDEVIVERIMSGRSPGVAGEERKEAVRRLAAFGMSDSDIGRRIGMGSNNLQWFRIRHGIPGGVPRPGSPGGGGVAA